MRHDFIDRYSRLDSPVHALPAGLKFAFSFLLVFATVLTPMRYLPFFVAASFVLVVIAGVSRIPPAFLLRRLLLLEPVAVGVACLSLLQPGGTASFITVIVKSTISLLAVILLSNTTPFAEILGVLRRLRAPSLLVTVLALMYRYLFVLIDEMERMQRARRSRTFAPRRVSRWRMLAAIIGELFVRSTERAERIYAAMCARGWK